MKCLDYQTPNEMFKIEMSQLMINQNV
jgi:hypothetical protein